MVNSMNTLGSFRRAVFGAILTMGVLVPSASEAIIFDVVGVVNNGNVASIDFEYDASQSLIDISITNNGTFGSDPRITGFSFNAPDSVTGASAFTASGTTNDTDWTSSFGSISTPGTSGTFDAAAITGNNFEGGSPNSGIAVGTTATFQFTLSGLNLGSLVTMDFLSILTAAKDDNPAAAFAVRFQRTGIDGDGSDTAIGGPNLGTGGGGVPPTIPVPAALPLFGTGIALLGFLGWRRKHRSA